MTSLVHTLLVFSLLLLFLFMSVSHRQHGVVLTAVMPYAVMAVMGMGSLLGYSFSLGHLLTFGYF